VTAAIPHFTARCASIAWRQNALLSMRKTDLAQCMQLLDTGFWIMLKNVQNKNIFRIPDMDG